MLPVRGGERFLQAVFEPLGYAVEAIRHPLDERFPEWGDSPYFSVTISKTTTLSELLTHLYVLIPVFDNPSTTSSATTSWRSCWQRAAAGWPATPSGKRSPAAT